MAIVTPEMMQILGAIAGGKLPLKPDDLGMTLLEFSFAVDELESGGYIEGVQAKRPHNYVTLLILANISGDGRNLL